MSKSIFPRLFGTPTKLDFVLPELCSNCGLQEPTHLKEVNLFANRFGIRVVAHPGFAMDLPFCGRCESVWVRQPVTVSNVRRRFLSGTVARISLRCRNHEFAQALKNLNKPLVNAGWLQVIDGDQSDA
jgi:hypothetical protein